MSRPCKRCISLKKEDTCQDMQHKKRGRPKLREKKVYSSKEHTFEILYGTIQTPAITMKNTTTGSSSNIRNIIPNHQVPPFKAKLPTKPAAVHTPAQPVPVPSSLSSTSLSSSIAAISFIHEPIESFQQPLLNSPPTLESNNTKVPMVQLSSNAQPIFVNNTTSSKTNITIILSMDVCCAKVSDDTIKCWGYYPQELAHRSFYDFISPKDSDRLARLHRLLLDNVTNNNINITLPPTERTTSTLFSNTDQHQLQKIAHGSRSFSDTIHIKKRSGEYELYEVVVYVGGGLGADLFDLSTLNKQYIVAQFKKHEYEVTAVTTITSTPTSTSPLPITTSTSTTTATIPSPSTMSGLEYMQPIAVFSPLLTPISPSDSSIFNLNPSNTPSTAAAVTSPSSIHLINKTGSPLLNTFRKDSQSKFAQLNGNSSTTSVPKFNIAPITTIPKHAVLPHQTNMFPRSYPPTSIGSSVVGPTAEMRLRRGMAPVTHPTQQYFLQTSSSTLNAAAASAHQQATKSNSNDASVVPTDRKIEMSIRSLLC